MDMTETEVALMQVIVLLITSIIAGDAERRAGFDKGLAHFREEFKAKGQLQTAATIESIRMLATDEKSNAAVLEAFIESLKAKKKN